MHRLTCATLYYARSLLCSGRQSLLRLGSFFVPSSKLFPPLPTSRKHSSLVLWTGSVGGCIRDTEEADRGLGSRAEHVRCFRLEFVRNIFCPEIPPIEALGYEIKRNCTRNILIENKSIPPLSRKLVFFANRNTPKNMQLLEKIHTVFTAALRPSLNMSVARVYKHPSASVLSRRQDRPKDA